MPYANPTDKYHNEKERRARDGSKQRAAEARWRAAHPEKERAKSQTPKARARQKKLREENGEKIKRDQFRIRYGLTLDAYHAMVREQGGVCAICKQPPSGKTKYGTPRPLYVDHHHDSKAVRGLLCDRCNCMIGFAKDSAAILHAGAFYLGRH